MASSNKSDTIGVIRTAATSFGFNLKQEQESALKEFVGGRDVYVHVYRCQQDTESHFATVCCLLRTETRNRLLLIVVSLLISLMKDQTDAFNRLGVSSACVSNKEETSKEFTTSLENN